MRNLVKLAAIAVMLLSPGAAGATLLGPTSYLSFADSPFSGGSFSSFSLEDFEDQTLLPGVTASAGGVASVVFGPSLHDSVDADDGAIDGSGLLGDSFFSGSGGAGIRFTFNAAILGGLPTHAGIVWTDGGGTTRFEAFDASLVSLGVIGPVAIADGSFSGTTDEDRFFGAINLAGISSILISNSAGGIEVDHLQFGFASVDTPPTGVPEPMTLSLLGAGLAGIGMVRRRLPARSRSIASA